MDSIQQAGTVFARLNSLMILGLVTVWVPNYRTVESSPTLDLGAFGGVLLVENLLGIYFWATSALYAMGQGWTKRSR